MRLQVFLDSRFGVITNQGAHVFWLQDPLIVPSTLYEFSVRVPFVAVPLTNYNIEIENKTLHILNDVGGPLTIELPLRKHSIDELLEAINRRLVNGFPRII